MRITSQVPTKDQPTPHSHKLHIDTVCLCRNVLDPCHGFTFSFTFPISTTTQLFFRCYAALRQAQGRHRGRQFGAHARGSMARSLPSQSFTSLPMLLEYFLSYQACPRCGLYPSSNYKTNTGACYLPFQALFNCQSVSLTEHASFEFFLYACYTGRICTIRLVTQL